MEAAFVSDFGGPGPGFDKAHYDIEFEADYWKMSRAIGDAVWEYARWFADNPEHGARIAAAACEAVDQVLHA
jgi:hypothetical protein